MLRLKWQVFKLKNYTQILFQLESDLKNFQLENPIISSWIKCIHIYYSPRSTCPIFSTWNSYSTWNFKLKPILASNLQLQKILSTYFQLLFNLNSGHELKGAISYLNCGVMGLNVPLMCLVDYRGHRLIAMSVLPIDDNTIIYGTW